MKIITIVGARPQFIKAAGVSRAIMQDISIHEVMVHTGQHYDANMSDIFFEELGIPTPAYHLGIGDGSHGQNTGRTSVPELAVWAIFSRLCSIRKADRASLAF